MKRVCPYLFVYGSLRPAVGHPMLRRLQRDAHWMAGGYCTGDLYDLGSYPGAVIRPESAGRIYGDVFRMRSPRRLLSVLDRYEGCGSRAPAPREYSRVNIEVITAGKRIKAWMYVYNRPVQEKNRIPSGDYLTHSRALGRRRYVSKAVAMQ